MANRYWVGGSGTWNTTSTTNWSATSGGAAGATRPTSADSVFFDQAGTYTVTLTGALNCLDFTISAGIVSFVVGTTPSLGIAGSLTLLTGGGGLLGTITFTATTTGKTITTNGCSLAAVVFNGTGGGWTLGSALTVISTCTLTAGALVLNNFTFACTAFSSSNLNVRSVNFGTGNIALTSATAGTSLITMSNMTNWTYSGTGGFSRNMIATGSFSLGNSSGGTSTNAPNVSVTGDNALNIASNSIFKNFVFPSGLCSPQGPCKVFGSLFLSASGVYSMLFIPTFSGTGTLTSNGKTLDTSILNSIGGTLTLSDAASTGAEGSFTLTAGTLDLNSQTLSCGRFVSNNSNTRALSFGSSNITLISTTSSATIIDMANSFGCTFSGTGGFIRNQAIAAAITCGSTSVSTTRPNLLINAGAAALTITVGSSFNNVNFTGSSCTLSGGITTYGATLLSTTGTYTGISISCAGGSLTSVGKMIGALNIITGTTVFVDAVSILGVFNVASGRANLGTNSVTCDSFVSNSTVMRELFFGSGAVINVTGSNKTVLDLSGTGSYTVSGVFYVKLTYSGSAGVRSILVNSFGSKSLVTSGTVNIVLDPAATDTISLLNTTGLSDINLTGYAGALTVTTAVVNCSGGLILGVGTSTLESTGTLNLTSSIAVARPITTNGVTIKFNIALNTAGSIYTLQDALTISPLRSLTHSAGTFTTNNFNVTLGKFSSTGSTARIVNMGSSTWTITHGTTNAWDISTATNLTLNSGTSTINLTGSTQTFIGGGLTYYNLNLAAPDTFTITGANTFNNITNTSQPLTVIFPASTTTVFSNFNLSGVYGYVCTIQSSIIGTQATLSKASGTVMSYLLSIKDINATGGATWNATSSTDVSGNTGWVFLGTVVIAAVSTFFLMF